MMDLRGMPLSVVEAGVRALQEQEATRTWVEAYPGSDADLLTDLAPVVQASIVAWADYRILAAECEGGAGHSYQISLDEQDQPVGVVCGHCTTNWVVDRAPLAPHAEAAAEEGPPDPGPAPADDGEVPAAPPAATRKLAADLRPPPAAPVVAVAAEPEEDVGPRCSECDEPIDETNTELATANKALSKSDPPLCENCMLSCTEDRDHRIETIDQAVLSRMRHQGRLCKPCMAARKTPTTKATTKGGNDGSK